MLCSDGLWEMVRDPQLTNILTEVDDLNETVNLLIQRANENGGEDNITAVIVRGVAG
jgi:serine/threonine protein phosphatase PrpC